MVLLVKMAPALDLDFDPGKDETVQAEQAAEKNDSFCHSERSEESLFDSSIREESKRDASPRSE